MKKGSIGTSKLISGNFPEETAMRVQAIAEERNTSRSAILRAAVIKYLDEGANDGQINMNIIVLSQKLQEVQNTMSEADYKEMKDLVSNIVKLRGGI